MSLTVSPGGLGKSSLALVEALAMVTGKPLIGAAPPRPLRVWYWCGEDPADEIERRVSAACLHYDPTAIDLDGRPYTDSGRAVPIHLGGMGRDGAMIARPQVEALVSAIQANAVDVLMIDSFLENTQCPKAASVGGNGVIHMGLLNIIRRMHLRQKLSIREIARRTGLSRNTVTKHLAADTVVPRLVV